ncbi:MAG: flagellar basal body rod protein FlgC [Planctomycetes bacterium]|nr:flagellar basal body rod protein FlgC [Planctomycetota bacterium]
MSDVTSASKFFTGMRICASGLSAERERMDVIAENLANARTTRTPGGGPYRRKVVLFEPLLEEFEGHQRSGGVRATPVQVDASTEFERVLDPGHPDADKDGMVLYPNVNTVMEMADLITSMRAYEANLTAQENFTKMAERALDLLR